MAGAIQFSGKPAGGDPANQQLGKSQFDLFRWAWAHSFVRRIADHSFPDRPGSDTKCHQACGGHGNKYISACGKAIYTARHRR